METQPSTETLTARRRIYRKSPVTSARILPLGVAALGLLAVLLFGLTIAARDWVELEVHKAVASALHAQGFTDLSVTAHGQNVLISGALAEDRRSEVLELAAAALGDTWAGPLASVLWVDGAWTVPPPPPPKEAIAPPAASDAPLCPCPVPPPTAELVPFNVHRDETSLGMYGVLPTPETTEDIRTQAAALAAESRPPLTVIDQLVTSTTAPPGTANAAQWMMKAIRRCTEGSLAVDDTRISVLCSLPEAERPALDALTQEPLEAYTLGPVNVLIHEEIASCEAQLSTYLEKHNITFETARARLRPEAQPVLDAMVEAIRSCPGTLRVEGHTDSDGADTANQRLSQQRAEAVVTALIERGIAPEALVAVGLGETQPRADNATPEGKAQNRRIEFRVITH